VKAILVRARSELRARLPSMLALALLLGLGGGAVMTLAAGARRTTTSYPRFAREYRAADVLLFNYPSPPGAPPQFANLDFGSVERLPQVAASGVQHFLAADGNLSIISGEAGFGVTVDRAKILAGRWPRVGSLDETAVSFDEAKQAHLHVGSALKTQLFGVTGDAFPATLRVVGIEATPGEFPPELSTNSGPGATHVAHVSDAFYRYFKAKNVFSLDFLVLRLRRGAADLASLNDSLNQLAAEQANGLPQLNQSQDAQAVNVQRSIHLQAVALWIVSALVALIGLLVLSQLLVRQAGIDASENPTLLALGMSRTQVWMTGMARAAAIGVAGAIVAVVSAYFASALMPIGTARIAEPNSGLSFDPLTLGIGAAAAMVIVLVLAAWPVWRSTIGVRAERVGSEKPSIAARSAAAPGFPPPLSAGVRFALEAGRGRTEVPVRSSLMSVVLAIAALAGALTFGACLDHLLSSPRQYGWNWDAHVTSNSDTATAEGALKIIGRDPDIESIAFFDTPPVVVGQTATSKGASFDLIAFDQKRGLIQPVVIEGRAPRTPDEIALGVKTLRELHKHIGSTVTMSISAIAGGHADFTIVGTVVLPPSSDRTRLGEGGVTLYEGLKRTAPPTFHHFPVESDLVFTFAPGVNKKQALAKVNNALSQDYQILLPEKPTDLVNFGQVQNLPLLLAGLVGLLAAATLAHTLVTSIRRRRRDLAILKMLGFVPRQVRAAVAWQATTFVSVALLIGLPVGIAVGRVVWIAFANQLGTLPDPVTPSLRLLLAIPAAIVLANVIAVVPAVMAGRMKPAPALRAE